MTVGIPSTTERLAAINKSIDSLGPGSPMHIEGLRALIAFNDVALKAILDNTWSEARMLEELTALELKIGTFVKLVNLSEELFR